MADLNKLREEMEDAMADVTAAFEHKKQVMADLITAEARVHAALKQKTEAVCAYRAAISGE